MNREMRVESKIPLTTNAYYGTALGSGTESNMYASVDEMCDDDNALKKTDIPLTTNASY